MLQEDKTFVWHALKVIFVVLCIYLAAYVVYVEILAPNDCQCPTPVNTPQQTEPTTTITGKGFYFGR